MTESTKPEEHTEDHHDHSSARQEHVDWKESVVRWRQEYHEAVLAFTRRSLPDLELQEFEAALDRHESAMAVAIEIHEQALDRHERAMQVEERGARGASEGFGELHEELDNRHMASRETHATLRRRKREILEALRGSK